ncbi:MAG: hypothetical protein KGQ41_02530 [Alphaproteobacteria bacterium]|nr:hypothetical protein [Alphaproteobacteria bacterium]
MPDNKLITLLIQDKLHFKKLREILPVLPEGYDFEFLVDDMFARAKMPEGDIGDYRFIMLSRFGSEAVLDGISETTLLQDFNYFLARFIDNPFLKPLKKPYRVVYAAFIKFMQKHLPLLFIFLSESKKYMQAHFWEVGEQAVHTYVSAKRPAILILAEANVQFSTEAFIKIFHSYGIKSVITPYTFCKPDEPANYYMDNPLFQARWYHRRKLPNKWFHTYRGHDLVRMPYLMATMCEERGYSPPQPWVLESSTADAIQVESAAMKRHYVSQNIPDSQIKVVGDVTHDLIAYTLHNRASERARYEREHGVTIGSKKVILFAVFPDLFNYNAEAKDDFDSYDEALTRLVDTMSGCNDWITILSIHPRYDASIYKKYERGNVKILKWMTAEAIGICDLYIASISATIRWAIAAGVPVINYDLYKLDYADYCDVPAVLTAHTWPEFRTIFEKATTDEGYLRTLQQSQRASAPDWGALDGQFKARFQQLLLGYIQNEEERKEAA